VLYWNPAIQSIHAYGRKNLDQIELEVDHREILGKSVRALRRGGITPVHLFGSGIESQSLQCETSNLIHVLTEAGQTRLVNLKIAGDKKKHSVLVRNVQVSPVKSELIHVDFFEVSLAEKVRIDVPIVLASEAPITKHKEYILVQDMDSLSVECLPADMPNEATLDLAVLTEPDHTLKIADIDLGEGVTILDDPEHVVARISMLRLAEEEEEVAEEVEEGAVAPEGEEEAGAAVPEAEAGTIAPVEEG